MHTNPTPQRSRNCSTARHALGHVIFLLILATVLPAAAGESIRSGTLELTSNETAERLPAVRLGTDLDVTVTGPLARVRVTQAFRNTSPAWMAATYHYPLPPDAAVDDLTMVVGQKVIVGEIQPQGKARELYEAAKADGRKAGLVSQQRPNLFTNRVANIGPGETVLVSIEFQMPIRQAERRYSLRLPLVAGPRYQAGGSGSGKTPGSNSGPVSESPVLNPALGERINPVSVRVDLRPGFVPAGVESPHHDVVVEGAGNRRRIRLADGEVPADRDFVLHWQVPEQEPSVALFRQRVDDEDYVMATITPPSTLPDTPPVPRELVFVIDNSGSMGGESMRQARASLVKALDTLAPGDRFNAIRFNDTTTRLFETGVAATPANLAIARRYARSLEAGGGTQMLSAVEAALSTAVEDESRLRQVIFLTDGAISNEAEILAMVGRHAGTTRLFPVGIGSAPNSYLMTRMASLGRGSFTYISRPAEVEAGMTSLLERLRRPVLTDLTVETSDAGLRLTPDALPDVHAGEPVVLLGRADELTGTLTLRGRRGDQPWQATMKLAHAQPSTAVAKRWARRRIEAIEADRLLGQLDTAAADARTEALGMRFGIVTRQTSLVAVDDTPSRPDGAPLTESDLPINLPSGWDFEGLFGRDRQEFTAPDGGTQLAGIDGARTTIPLPQTAMNFAGPLRTGLLLTLLALAGLALTRRRGRPEGTSC